MFITYLCRDYLTETYTFEIPMNDTGSMTVQITKTMGDISDLKCVLSIVSGRETVLGSHKKDAASRRSS